MIPIPREVYFAIAGVVLLALIAWGVKSALDHQYDKGAAAGSAAATIKCNEQIDGIQTAADVERRRLAKIAIDLGLELAKRQAALNALAGKITKESDDEITAHPLPAVCDWSDDRVRITNDAARGAGASGT